ncbi:MAG: FeS cluster assembly protein SufB [candidate division WS6 bacterium OLB20]|uniref:FeS cluster assembly protein SufB n=1 Tax=candidate division WS6 bacterium OLB20 TaxID=1617426 RepID=A0A136LWX6_9BACT|nr:MAG: FeS cluster assembly protein SufB [candidate division WS6 bacterium OLB20]
MSKNLQQQKTNAGDIIKEEVDIVKNINADYVSKYGFADTYKSMLDIGKGLNEDIIRRISALKGEDEWMLKRRLEGYKWFLEKPMPTWGADLSGIDFDNIHYFVRATDRGAQTWDDVPPEIKETFDKLGIPEAERKFLAGVATQYESEVVYHNLHEKFNKLGVVFLDTDTAYKEYPDLFHEHFGKVIPASDNKFAALNTATWSGGSFIYVPKGVKVDIPLQAYFRINAQNMGQFERTLIIADEGSDIHYIEGCTAPIYSSDSLHSAVVEIVVKRAARVRYTTIQNWSSNVYNLVTKRATVRGRGVMEWIDCNLGSKVTMKYPSVYLLEPEAHGEVLSIALAQEGQHQDAGAKIIHRAPRTSSLIQSKSICKDGGRTSYRGLLKIADGAKGSKSKVICDALILDNESQTDTYPFNVIDEKRRDSGARSIGFKSKRRAAVLLDESRSVRGGGVVSDRVRIYRADRQRTSDGIRHGTERFTSDEHGRQRRLISKTYYCLR